MTKLLDDIKEALFEAIEEENISVAYAAGWYEILEKNVSSSISNAYEYYHNKNFPLYLNVIDSYNLKGEIRLTLELPYDYVIKLEYDERYWGYCQCESSDAGYNAEHNCCGYNCDYTAPSITIEKCQSMSFEFDGNERDLWELEATWNGVEKEEYNNQVKNENIKNIEDKIKELTEARDKLIGGIN